MLGVLLGCVLAVAAVVAATNAVTVLATKDRIVSAEAAASFGADAIVVLGASVYADGTPSGILQDRLDDRLDDGIALYFAGAAPKIIMSGDNSTVSYNEVKAMKDYAVAQGVPSEDVFCDHAGFSTYESMYRAKHVFGAERIVAAWAWRPSACRAITASMLTSFNTMCARSPRAPRTSSRRCFACPRRSWAILSASTSRATSPRARRAQARALRTARRRKRRGLAACGRARRPRRPRATRR